MNPYSAFGKVMNLGKSTSSDEVAKLPPGAQVVTAFNTMRAGDLLSGAFRSGKDRWAKFLAGDDADAKRVVSGLIEGIGFVPIDTGALREGGQLQQPGSPIYTKRLTEDEARALLPTTKG